MSITPIAQDPKITASAAQDGASAAPGFDAALGSAVEDTRVLTRKGKADFVSGQVGVNVSKDGKPIAVLFFDENGKKLTQIAFNAQSILKTAERLNIPLSDLNGLADELDEAKTAYAPYALYAGTGSDHGIDLRDLASGGLGTAYDWRRDSNIGQKGPVAALRLAEAQAMADRMGLVANPEVTTGGGLAVSTLAPQVDKEGVLRSYVVTNGGSAAWYRTQAEATAAANAARAALLDLTQTLVGKES